LDVLGVDRRRRPRRLGWNPEGLSGVEGQTPPRNDLAEHLDERTRIVWLETPTNPLLNVIEIEAAAKTAHEVGAMVVVDDRGAALLPPEVPRGNSRPVRLLARAARAEDARGAALVRSPAATGA